MSTSFEVYPGTKSLPTFGELISRSTAELHDFLDTFKFRSRPTIHVKLQHCNDNSQVQFSMNDPAFWNKKTYAWFTFNDIPGGTGGYYCDDAARIQTYWEGELAAPNSKRLEPEIRECAKVGHYWWFRRSMGQPAIVNLGYGLIAGSLAALTNGIVHSIDGAWDYDCLPALPANFLSWYFRPEKTSQAKAEFRAWSYRCLGHLGDELGERCLRFGK